MDNKWFTLASGFASSLTLGMAYYLYRWGLYQDTTNQYKLKIATLENDIGIRDTRIKELERQLEEKDNYIEEMREFKSKEALKIIKDSVL